MASALSGIYPVSVSDGAHNNSNIPEIWRSGTEIWDSHTATPELTYLVLRPNRAGPQSELGVMVSRISRGSPVNLQE